MTTSRVLRSVVYNFLGTYTSRNSDYRGYWLFGFLVGHLEKLQFDLTGDAESSDSAVVAAHKLAVKRFSEQLCKANVQPSVVRLASLRIERLDGQVTDRVNGRECSGFNIQFRVTVTSDTGKVFECERVLFVAPHDSLLEFRSGRGAAGKK